MKELNLLIVEDDSAVIKGYSRNITSYNIGSDVKIQAKYIENKDEAIDYISNSKNVIDAAIIDLDLVGTVGEDRSGNEVIRAIKGKLRFPVFVISGTPQNVDSDLKKESTLFKIKTRGEEGDYIEDLVEIFNTGISNLLNRDGEIEKLINSIYWNHLSNSLNIWIQDETRGPEQKERSLLRYTILHMLEYLDEGKIHPSEFYITPPIKNEIFTGDIVKFGNERYLVLTPSCDIVVRPEGSRNAQKILFCKIRLLEDVVVNYSSLKSTTSSNNSTRKKLNSYIENKKQNYHFIPPSSSIKAGLVDFQDKLTLKSEKVDEFITAKKIIRIATVSMPFLKDIISRYTNYFSRQGSPDFSVNEVYDLLFEEE